MWRATDLARDLSLSPDGRRVSSVDRNGWRNCISDSPVEDFTMRVGHDAAARVPGWVYIGLIRPESFQPNTYVGDAAGIYTLWPIAGMLCGSNKVFNTPYCTGFSTGLVRCVYDRAACTITFYVDGVARGVAWTDVPPGPLHAVVMFGKPGIHIDLV